MKQPLRIAITSGDTDGIGTEVVSKALYRLKPKKGVQYYLWRSPKTPIGHVRMISRNFTRVSFASWHEALAYGFQSEKEIIEIVNTKSPAIWVEEAAIAANFKHIDAIATAPLSKTCIQKAGLKDIGHTDILKRITKSKHVYMSFIGEEFSVVLATGHIPIKKVEAAWTKENLVQAIRQAQKLRKHLDNKSKAKNIAVLGLNPHAGESGLIGNDAKIFQQVKQSLKNPKWLDGLLIPDVAFLPGKRKKYSIYICAYHDQGLLPFKSIHGREGGVHISLGLPFVRTSVDHGTAKDIFGKNKADYKSMLEAIQWAERLAKK
tara:strand:+ start:10312 stop:11268 length:957 start_codon:yes stop_codon:yes gene_type:complete